MKTPQEYNEFYQDIINNWQQIGFTFTGRAMPQPRLNARSRFAGKWNPGLQKKADNYMAFQRDVESQFIQQMLTQYGKMFKIPDNSRIILNADFYLAPHRGRQGDIDNFVKSILDILKNAGLFKDDVMVISLQDCNKIPVKFPENQQSRIMLFWQDKDQFKG